jgi:hypothetical protein
MKQITKSLAILFLAVLAMIAPGFISLPGSVADAGSCILQATDDDVFIIIYDLNSDGSRRGQIWEGRINAGQTARIVTPHGQFDYDYNSQPDTDQPLSGGTERWCNNDEVILVP